MHFLLLFVRLMLSRVVPALRDGLTLAARADGRIEHLPLAPRLWDRWLSRSGRCAPRTGRRALAVRADDALRRTPDSGSD